MKVAALNACPFSAGTVQDAPSIKITTAAEALFILRDRTMATLRPESGHGGQFYSRVVSNSVVDMWGEPHLERRRLYAAIFGSQKLIEIEQHAIAPGVLEPLERLRELSREQGGPPRADLLLLVRRAAIRMSARVIGLEGLDDDDEIDRFDVEFRLLERGGRSKFVDNPGPVVEEALLARERLIAKYAEPVWQAREPLVERVRAGLAPQSELPPDLITVMMLNPEHFDSHVNSRPGELALLMIAAIGSSANGVCGAAYDLLRWVEKHPEDRAQLLDPAFLHRAQQESTRIHQTADLFRTAMADVTLPNGVTVPKGTVAVIDRMTANKAMADAGESELAGDEFDPYRTLGSKFPQQGLAFGHGPHMCIGRGLVMGDGFQKESGPRHGFMTNMLRVLFAAGAEFVPGERPTFYADMSRRETFKTFPIQFSGIADFEKRLAEPDKPA